MHDIIHQYITAKQKRKVWFVMANTLIKRQHKTEQLDQMLEDLAGEELNEFDDDFGLSPDLDKFSDADDFADIDSYH